MFTLLKSKMDIRNISTADGGSFLMDYMCFEQKQG